MRARPLCCPAALLFPAALLLLLFSSGGCRQKATARAYEEKGQPPAQTATPAIGKNGSPTANWQWQKPAAWTQEEASGMRLATLHLSAGPASAECSIIPLQGEAGGLRANVDRWLQQLGQEPFSDRQFVDFLSKQEKIVTRGGGEGLILDLTNLAGQRGDRQHEALLVGVIRTGTETLFVKLGGDRSLLRANRQQFRNFCLSFHKGTAP